jgi:saccharopine dehydrogenase-like NADP-dependent oxidoreductase
VYERIDYFDRKWHITSMGRMTAYPTSVIAQLMAAGVIRTRGAMTPEECVPLEPLLRGLQERGIEIAESWRERDR